MQKKIEDAGSSFLDEEEDINESSLNKTGSSRASTKEKMHSNFLEDEGDEDRDVDFQNDNERMLINKTIRHQFFGFEEDDDENEAYSDGEDGENDAEFRKSIEAQEAAHNLEEEEEMEENDAEVPSSSGLSTTKRNYQKMKRLFGAEVLEEKYMTEKDDEIKATDAPERIQVRAPHILQKNEKQFSLSNDNFLAEAKWIFQNEGFFPELDEQFEKRFDDWAIKHPHNVEFLHKIQQHFRDKQEKNFTESIQNILKLYISSKSDLPYIGMFEKDKFWDSFCNDLGKNNVDYWEDLWRIGEADKKWHILQNKKTSILEIIDSVQGEITHHKGENSMEFDKEDEEDIDISISKQNSSLSSFAGAEEKDANRKKLLETLEFAKKMVEDPVLQNIDSMEDIKDYILANFSEVMKKSKSSVYNNAASSGSGSTSLKRHQRQTLFSTATKHELAERMGSQFVLSSKDLVKNVQECATSYFEEPSAKDNSKYYNARRNLAETNPKEEPLDLARKFLNPDLRSPEDVLRATKHAIATLISKEPLLRQFYRNYYQVNGYVTVFINLKELVKNPKFDGLENINMFQQEQHTLSDFTKRMSLALVGPFLKFLDAEQRGKCKVQMHLQANEKYDNSNLLNEDLNEKIEKNQMDQVSLENFPSKFTKNLDMESLLHVKKELSDEEVSNAAELNTIWTEQRQEILTEAMILLKKDAEKWLKSKIKEECQNFLIKQLQEGLLTELMKQPYAPYDEITKSMTILTRRRKRIQKETASGKVNFSGEGVSETLKAKPTYEEMIELAKSKHFSVLACVQPLNPDSSGAHSDNGVGNDESTTFVYVNENGEFEKKLVWKFPKNVTQNNTDLQTFAFNCAPDVIAIPTSSTRSLTFFKDIAELLKMEYPIVFVPDDVSMIYSTSPRSKKEFPELMPIVKRGISLARRLQDPLFEIAGLYSDSPVDNDLIRLIAKPNSNLLPQGLKKEGLTRFILSEINREELIEFLEQTIITAVSRVGIDINRTIFHKHKQCALRFVPGLGPRKAADLISEIQKLPGQQLPSRKILQEKKILKDCVYRNVVGFLKVAPFKTLKNSSMSSDQDDDVNSEYNGKYSIDVMDTTRIHPVDYDIAVRIAEESVEIQEEDALKLINSEPNPQKREEMRRRSQAEEKQYESMDRFHTIVKKTMKCPQYIRNLDLDAYAAQLEMNYPEYGRKKLVIRDIEEEFNDPFGDPRHKRLQQPQIVYQNPNELMRMDANSWPNSFFERYSTPSDKNERDKDSQKISFSPLSPAQVMLNIVGEIQEETVVPVKKLNEKQYLLLDCGLIGTVGDENDDEFDNDNQNNQEKNKGKPADHACIKKYDAVHDYFKKIMENETDIDKDANSPPVIVPDIYTLFLSVDKDLIKKKMEDEELRLQGGEKTKSALEDFIKDSGSLKRKRNLDGDGSKNAKSQQERKILPKYYRLIDHPLYFNVNFEEAREKLKDTQHKIDCVFRPSSRGFNLSLTMKWFNTFVNYDIEEEDKPGNLATNLGQKLYIKKPQANPSSQQQNSNNNSNSSRIEPPFASIKDIYERFVRVILKYGSRLEKHRKFCAYDQVEKQLREEKEKNPSVIPYRLTIAPQRGGVAVAAQFVVCYLPGKTMRKLRDCEVTREGYALEGVPVRDLELFVGKFKEYIGRQLQKK